MAVVYGAATLKDLLDPSDGTIDVTDAPEIPSTEEGSLENIVMIPLANVIAAVDDGWN